MTISLNTIATLRTLTLDSISKLTRDSIYNSFYKLHPELSTKLGPDTFPCVTVQGYYEPGDGGGGSFMWDPNLEGEDFGTIIKPDSVKPVDNGRWKRLFKDNVSVKWFGARGDMTGTMEELRGKGGTFEMIKGNLVSDILTLTTLAAEFNLDPIEKTIEKTVILWDDMMVNRFMAKITNPTDYLSPVKVKLDKSRTPEMKNVNVAWGTDDTVPIQRALNLAEETGVSVYIPPGHYLITNTLHYLTIRPKWSEPKDPMHPQVGSLFLYPLMRHGLQLLGAGAKVSFIHNQILDEDGSKIKDHPTIVIDGGASIIDGKIVEIDGSFDNTGLLKDFHITSTGQNPDTVGIDMRSAWFYTIQNVHIMKMGSHAIRIRNNYSDLVKSGDGNTSDKVHLDNVFAYRNAGWGLIVDVKGRPALSIGRMYIERSWFDQNKLGGVQWVGQIGTIENCGFYGNGTFYNSYIDPQIPEPTTITNSGATGYGILIKNVKGTPDGLLITKCEIQDNADVQVMVESGSNIRIVQNEFKVDNLDKRYTFPSVDIQVGDANFGDNDINALNYSKVAKTPKTLTDMPGVNDFVLTEAECVNPVIVLSSTPPLTKPTVIRLPVTKENQWILHNDTNIAVKYGKAGVAIETLPSVAAKSWAFIRAYQKDVSKKIFELLEVGPRTVNNCVIEDNLIRLMWKSKDQGGAWGTDKPSPPTHTVVKVNSNAVGTIIRGWSVMGFPEDNTINKLVDLVETDPLTDKRRPNISPIQFKGMTHVNTSLHRDGIYGGHVLLPFASTQVNIGLQWQDYTPNTSLYCNYRFRLVDNVMVLNLKNPTIRTIGSPLFLEFVNGRKDFPVLVKFGDEYSITDLTIPPSKIVTGILLFGIDSKWTPFSPWTCEGKCL